MYSYEEFTLQYQLLSDKALVEIIHFPEQYQPLAVQAATAVLNSRNISVDEIAILRQSIVEEKLQKKEQSAVNKINKKAAEFFVKDDVSTPEMVKGEDLLYDAFASEQTGMRNTRRIIRTISIVYAVLTLLLILGNIKSYAYLLGNRHSSPLIILSFIVPTLASLAGIILFALYKKSGWVIMIIISGVAIFSIGTSFYYYVMSMLQDVYYKQRFPVQSVFFLLFHAAIIYNLCRVQVRTIYKVSRHEMFVSLGISVGVGLLLLLAALFAR